MNGSLRPHRPLIPATLTAAALLLTSGALASQQQQEHHSPYADQESSGIAALSAPEMRGLLEGEGMGLARAAEMNGYPGPKHVLELAGDLDLQPGQREAVEAIFLEMQTAAKELGAKIVDAERVLDRRFQHRHIDSSTLAELTAQIASLRGELRAVHLVAHLSTTDLLSDEQIARYSELRGYGEQDHAEHAH